MNIIPQQNPNWKNQKKWYEFSRSKQELQGELTRLEIKYFTDMKDLEDKMSPLNSKIQELDARKEKMNIKKKALMSIIDIERQRVIYQMKELKKQREQKQDNYISQRAWLVDELTKNIKIIGFGGNSRSIYE